MNNRFVSAVLIMLGFLSCTKPVEEMESPVNKENILHHYQEILEIVNNRGFIPIELMYDDFSISEIDFSKHWVLNEIGLQDVSLQRMSTGIEATFKSQSSELNGLVMKLTPKKDGFRSEITDKQGTSIDYTWSLDTSLEQMIVLGADGKRKVYNAQNPNRDGENAVMNAQFKSSVIIAYVLREFYFRQLDLEYEDLYPEGLNAAVNSRIDGTPTCEHFASVYYSCLGLTYSDCYNEVTYNIHSLCSNQYCIGCCKFTFDHSCQFGGLYCFGTGSGHACLDSGTNSGEGFGGNNCDANTPCPCGGGC